MSHNQGWIKLHRRLINWEWYSDPNTFRLFIHLLLISNHTDNKYKGIIIKPGQVVTGQDKLSIELGLSRQSIRTALANLKSTNDITIESSRKGSIIQVVNYGKYQHVTIKQPTHQPQSNHETTSNNNDKKDKEERKESFDIFWSKYPKKVSKTKTKDKFIKLSDKDIKTILDTLDSFISYKPFTEYTHPNPTTYLNQKRWEDELPTIKTDRPPLDKLVCHVALQVPTELERLKSKGWTLAEITQKANS